MSNEFAQKMAGVARAAGYVQKDAVNSFHKYKYASADAVLSAVREAMAEQGLYFSSATSELVALEPVCVIKKTLTVTDGTHTATGEGHGAGTDKGDKAPMKAETAAMKYAVAALFAISWGDDPESDAKTDELANGGKKASPKAKGLPVSLAANPKTPVFAAKAPEDPFRALWNALTQYVEDKDHGRLAAFWADWQAENADVDPKRLEKAKAQVSKLLGEIE